MRLRIPDPQFGVSPGSLDRRGTEAAVDGPIDYRPLRFLDGAVRGAKPAVQASITSRVAFVIMLVVCRFASPIARPRSEPAAEFAPLSHMLMKGFFFNHGLVMSVLLWVAKPEGQEALTVAA